ncbi:MAG: hypothetical protein GKC10_01675 [Methanosarcinales archaeon]|nr:hypothetical protein [Methanosarcinales archaeon]
MKAEELRAVVEELERGARCLDGERTVAQELKRRSEEALEKAEARPEEFAPLIERLDYLLMVLTEKAKENVCTNTKCPHYGKKCRMR